MRLKVAIPLLLGLASCRPLQRECGVWLDFASDYNMEYADAFAARVETVDAMVFTTAGRFVESRRAATARLEDRRRMWLGGLPPGRYKIVAVGNFSDEHFDLTHASLDRTMYALKAASTSRDFPDLYFGVPVEVAVGADRAVCRVPLVRQTNRFDVALQTPSTRGQTPLHTVSIDAPDGGAYDCHNNPAGRCRVTYTPHTLRTANGRTEAHLNTMRLAENDPDGYRIAVRSVADGRELWSGDLIGLLAATKPAARPDGTPLPLAEYLDRRSDWNVVIVYNGRSAVRWIEVNGWIVWKQGMDA